MNNKFQKGDVVELLCFTNYSFELKRKIPFSGIVFSVPHDDYPFYNVYCKDINPDHYNSDLVICRKDELK